MTEILLTGHLNQAKQRRRVKRKSSELGPDQPAHPPCLIKFSCAYQYNLQYQIILQADSEGPDHHALYTYAQRYTV